MNDVIRVGIGNPISGIEVDIERVTELWEIVQGYFHDFSLAGSPLSTDGAERVHRISLDATDTIEFLRLSSPKDENWEPFKDRITSSWKRGYMSYIDFAVPSVSSEDRPPLLLISRFLQHVFLAMNLAIPGSCNFFRPIYVNFPDDSVKPPHLSADEIASAAIEAASWGWPKIGHMSFDQTWRWVTAEIGEIDLATTPSEKAAFTLLEFAGMDTAIDPGSILMLAQVIESLFVVETEGVVRLLRERIDALLGSPQSHKRWISSFYQLRSRIAHGSAPLLRPGRYSFGEEHHNKFYAERSKLVDQALAVLLAVMQDMILTETRQYRFAQQVIRSRTIDAQRNVGRNA
jgi:hypothetical protein